MPSLVQSLSFRAYIARNPREWGGNGAGIEARSKAPPHAGVIEVVPVRLAAYWLGSDPLPRGRAALFTVAGRRSGQASCLLQPMRGRPRPIKNIAYMVQVA
jgi:hypothetical protein